MTIKRCILFSSLILLVSLHSIGQVTPCNCQTLQKGPEKVKQCPVLPVAGDRQLAVAVSIGKNETDKYNYISVILRFQATALSIKGNLGLTLETGAAQARMITLIPFRSQKGYVGGSEISSSSFKLSQSDFLLIGKYPIRTVSFTLEDGLLHSFKVETNKTILIDQVKCL